MDDLFKRRFAWILRLNTYLWLNAVLLVLGLVLSIVFTNWAQGVGTSITASAIVGFLFVYQMHIDRQFDDARRIYDEFGIRSITQERSNKNLYYDHLMRCRKNFDIIGHSLSRFYDDMAPDVLSILDKRNVKIRLLLMDPDSDVVKHREREDASAERTDLAAEIRKATRLYADLRLKNIEIRYYDATPTVQYQKIDSLIFVGSYFVGIPSGREPALVLRSGSRLALGYEEHFEKIWNSFSRNAIT